MNTPYEHFEDPETIRSEGDALDQSIALNRIVMTMLQHQKENNKRMFVALLVSLLMNAVIFCGFLYYESLWEYEVTETVVEQEVSGDGSDINNVQGDQYKDNATHNEGGVE